MQRLCAAAPDDYVPPARNVDPDEYARMKPLADTGDPEALDYMIDMVWGPRGILPNVDACAAARRRIIDGPVDYLSVMHALEMASEGLAIIQGGALEAAYEQAGRLAIVEMMEAALKRPSNEHTGEAAVVLAWLLVEGRGVTPDPERALSLFVQAAREPEQQTVVCGDMSDPGFMPLNRLGVWVAHSFVADPLRQHFSLQAWRTFVRRHPTVNLPGAGLMAEIDNMIRERAKALDVTIAPTKQDLVAEYLFVNTANPDEIEMSPPERETVDALLRIAA